MNRAWQDLSYAMRSLIARPAFAFACIVSLSLGIGTSVAIFSVVDAVLLRALPYPNAARVIELKEVSAKGTRMNFAEPNFIDAQARNHSYEAMAVYSGGGLETMMQTVTIAGAEPVRAPVYVVSADFFRVLGIEPFMGRTFSAEELKVGAPAAIVSYGFWQRSLGSRTELRGATLRIANLNFPVVGVLPANLDFPKGADVWVPREMFPSETSRTAHNWNVIARLRPDATVDSARADLSAIGKQLKLEQGNATMAADFAVVPLQDYVVGNAKPALFAILGAVAFLLLVAATNVANLRLAQMSARQKEFAVRAALGAGRWRLAQQFITENLLLALLGGAGGVLLSFVGVDLLLKLNQGNLPRAEEITVSARALVFGVALSITIALLLGLISVAQFARGDVHDRLHESRRGQTAGVASSRLRSFFVVAQVCIALILLVGAGLLARSFVQLLHVDPGFRPEHTVVMDMALPISDDEKQQNRNAMFYRQLLERLRTLPGVMEVGGINALPLTDTGADGIFLIDNDATRTGNADYRRASSGYFAAMGIPLLRGRVFDSRDTSNAPPAAVISQSLAQKYFTGVDPIGQRIQFGNMDGDKRLLEVVGVVGNIQEDLETTAALTVYANAFQRPQASSLSMVVRAQTTPAVLVPAMRETIKSINPEVPAAFRTLRDVYSSSFDARRFSLVLFATFAAVTLTLALLGLYSVISYAVAQRTHEIGIRRALGAQGRDILALVLRRGMSLTFVGVACGIAGAWALTRLMTSLLFGITARDPFTFLGVTLLLSFVALVACLVPARRATRVDPLEALRYE
jgi:putative ABC transport system permease protein